MKKLLSFFLFILVLTANAQTVTVSGVFDYDEAKATVRAINKARTSVPETEGFHPDKRENAKVQISFDPAVESKVLNRMPEE